MTTGGAPAVSRLPESIWREEALARRFRVESELGRGGQAVVVVAYHRELDERVALKFLLPDVAQSTASIARFRREARAAAKIKNEHVVRIIDVCATESGIPYIVMEYLDGRDLEHVLQSAPNGQLAVPDAVDFVLQASEALAEGHRLGIVHRDLKPANLFCVDRDDGLPMIKVLDFGISKIQPLPGDVERTDRYEILGSPRYMSPEQIDASRDVDQRSDIWSLGVILYQAIAGRVPFGGEIVADLWHKIRTATPLPLLELRREVPAALNRAVMRCLEKEPARRFANLGEFADALACVAPEQSRNSITRILRATGTRPAAQHSSIPTLTTDPTLVAGSVPSSPHTRWRRSTVIGLCVGVCALAGLTATRLIPDATRPGAKPEVTISKPSDDGVAVPTSNPAPGAGTATGKPRSAKLEGPLAEPSASENELEDATQRDVKDVKDVKARAESHNVREAQKRVVTPSTEGKTQPQSTSPFSGATASPPPIGGVAPEPSGSVALPTSASGGSAPKAGVSTPPVFIISPVENRKGNNARTNSLP